MQDCKVNILGTEYQVLFGKESDYPNLKENDGYVDTSEKKIFVDDMTAHEGDIARKQNIGYYRNHVLRHEIIHAFLFESGLDNESCSPRNWACSEEIVDWFAIQSPKIFKVFTELGLM